MNYEIISNLELMRTKKGIAQRKKGYSAREVADLSGVNRSSVNQIDRNINVDKKALWMLINISRALGIPMWKTSESEDYLLEIIEKE
ncbi:MAG: hypothetical protein KAX49_15100 [Halanaerobiales bacterium]|nr:hypothetical protein [Halanaerobiales bacterium]